MKLVDILARELTEWAGDVGAITQDKLNGELLDYYHCPLRGGNEREVSSIADDAGEAHDGASGAAVTRAEWQAAVDALNAPKVVEWPSLGETVEVIKGPAEWDDYQRPMIGVEGKVRSVFKNDCDQKIIAIELPSGECKCFIVECIKPARTAEQVAAEEIEAIREFLIYEHCDGGLIGIAKALHESGYRKEPKSCGS